MSTLFKLASTPVIIGAYMIIVGSIGGLIASLAEAYSGHDLAGLAVTVYTVLVFSITAVAAGEILRKEKEEDANTAALTESEDEKVVPVYMSTEGIAKFKSHKRVEHGAKEKVDSEKKEV